MVNSDYINSFGFCVSIYNDVKKKVKKLGQKAWSKRPRDAGHAHAYAELSECL